MNRPENQTPAEYVRPAGACRLGNFGRTWLHKQERAGRITALRPSTRLTLYRVEDIRRLVEEGGAK